LRLVVPTFSPTSFRLSPFFGFLSLLNFIETFLRWHLLNGSKSSSFPSSADLFCRPRPIFTCFLSPIDTAHSLLVRFSESPLRFFSNVLKSPPSHFWTTSALFPLPSSCPARPGFSNLDSVRILFAGFFLHSLPGPFPPKTPNTVRVRFSLPPSTPPLPLKK